jgi:hypothetical protein
MDIYHKGNLIYRHKKARHQSDHQYIPELYLKILERKPRAIINAAPLKRGVFPHELSEFMKLCKHRDKNYQLVNILLLGKKPLPHRHGRWAVRQANLTGTPTYDLVCFYLEIKAESRFNSLDTNGLRKVSII